MIGNDAAITVAGSQGQFELNVRVPLIARNLLDSIKLLSSACRLLDTKCVAGHRGRRGGGASATPRRPWPRRRRSTRTSATTAATEIVKAAAERGGRCARSLGRWGSSEEILEQALDHRKMARPHD